MAYYRKEEIRILYIAQQESRNNFTGQDSQEEESTDEELWGYVQMPSRICPRIDLWIEWIYVIDLDQNVFRVINRNHCRDQERCGIQYFRLDNIPRWLFEVSSVSHYNPKLMMADNIMAASKVNVPSEYWSHDPRDVAVPNPELLGLYDNFSVQSVPVFSIPPAEHAPTWRSLQLQLLGQFVEHFLASFHDISRPRTSSPFIFRQLAYAVLSFTRSTGMKFRPSNPPHQTRVQPGNIRNRSQTPSWEPPDADNYWLGDVLIVLDEYIRFRNGQPIAMTKTTISKAVKLAGTVNDAVAVIFSVHFIVVVNIHQTPQGPEVSHSTALPLWGFDSEINAFNTACINSLKKVMYATPGIVALLDLFSSRPPVPPRSARVSQPWNLPNEICQQILRYADPTTQCALERSCGLFRDMATEYPRIGEWTLLKCSGDRRFVAFRSSTQSRYLVELGALAEHPLDGVFEVGLWGDDAKFQPNMPLLTVKDVA